MNEKIFDIAEKHAMEIEKDNINIPVFETESGAWFGSVYAMMKIESFEDWDGFPVDYNVLEDLYPHLKEKKHLMDDFDKWFDELNPEDEEESKIEFTEIITQAVGSGGISVGRVYTHKDGLGMIDTRFDYLGYDLDNSLDYIAKGLKSPIIGIRRGKGSIKQRALIVLMPLGITDNEVKNAIKRTGEAIKEIKEWPG